MAAVAQRVEQQAGLCRGSGAELDEGVCPRHGGDLLDATGQDGPFGAGRIVLGQTGDGIEEHASGGVVEPLGRQLLRVRRQSSPDVGRERRGAVGCGEMPVDDDSRVGTGRGDTDPRIDTGTENRTDIGTGIGTDIGDIGTGCCHGCNLRERFYNRE